MFKCLTELAIQADIMAFAKVLVALLVPSIVAAHIDRLVVTILVAR